MNILVAGGSGFIGSHIVREIRENFPTETVRIMTRRPDSSGTQRDLCRGDVTDPSSLPACVREVDVVIQCVQFPNHPVENPSRGWTYERIDGEGTVNLVRASKEAAVRRFVYLSGAGTAPGKPQPWFRAKHRAEEAVRNSGMEYAIFRPSWIYGPGDRSLNRLVAFTRSLPFVPVIGNGEAKVQPVSVFDLARIVALAVTSATPPNRVFEVGGPQRLSMNEILGTVQKVIGKRRPLLHTPSGLMKVMSMGMAILPNPPLSPSAIDFIQMEERVDPRPAEEYFGIRFEELERALRRYL
jgi:uncharacterized protein YbjT (DUF2867 family)